MLVHRRNWNTVICGDVETQSRNVRAMITKALNKYPSYLLGETVKFTPFEGSSKNKVIQNTNCVVSIGSFQKPDTLRSGDISGAHLTENWTLESYTRQKAGGPYPVYIRFYL
mgnify:CR=1 FL=1